MKIYESVYLSLKIMLNLPEGFKVFFLGSATECMDRIIQNTVIGRSFHFVNGAFSERFYNTAIELNKDAQKISAEYGKGFSDSDIKIPDETELICFTQNETSTGVQIDSKKIHRVKEENPGKLIAVDIVSSFPYVNLDFKLIDAAFFSVQKGLGLPAGLAVLIANDRCIEKARYIHDNGKGNIGSYHNFIKLNENAGKFQTTETPNTLGIFLLSKILEQITDSGIENIRNETEEKSNLLYQFFDDYEKANPFVRNPEDRSKTVIAVESDVKDMIVNKLDDEGYKVSNGYGKFKEKQFRIGNYPVHKIDDVNNIIEIIKAL